MHELPFRRPLLAVGVGALLLPLAAVAQVREVISKEVSVGLVEATLRLGFTDGGTLEISFEDGSALVDGEVVGSYVRGDELEAAWRSLLGEAVALDDGPLAEMLTDWSAPADLAIELGELARAVDEALESALTPIEVQVDPEPSVSVSIGAGSGRSLLEILLGSGSRLGTLAQALEDIGPNVRVHIDEDVVIAEGETVSGSLVAVQAAVRIEGAVEGDVVVVDGSLELMPGSRVDGEVRLADARLLGDESAVGGGVIDLLDEEREYELEIRDRLREELRSEMRREVRNVTRIGGDGRGALSAAIRSVFRGVGGLIENLVGIFILGLIGAGIVTFAGENMDNVAATARHTPGRAAVVGLAGTFLLLPVWILGTVALAVSIIGIPVLIAWVPLLPIAAGGACVMGYLAVARNAGEWLADSQYPWTHWIRKSNPIYTIFGGLVGLMFAFMAANVIGIAPFLGVIAGLLVFVGSIITFLAVQIGFGAVLLTRAGRRREYWPDYDAEAAWQAAMDVDREGDVGEAEPPEGGPEDEETDDA